MVDCDLYSNCSSTGDSGDTPIVDNAAVNIQDAIEDDAPNGGEGNGDKACPQASVCNDLDDYWNGMR